jgi:hypothetical protein
MAELASTAQDPGRDFIRATPRNPVLGYLSDLAGSSFSPERTQQMQSVAQFFGAPAISQTLNRMAYGEPLTTGAGGIGGTSKLRPEVAEAAMSVMDFLPTSGIAKGAAMAAPMAVGMLAGKKAATWNALAAAKAKMLADMGTDARTIWSETGTWKGPDGKWRQEIDGSVPMGNQFNPTPSLAIPQETKAIEAAIYQGSHKSPSPEFGAPLYDLTGGGQMYPADVYSKQATQYYGTGDPKADREAFALAQRVRGNPNAEVTMYRVVPKDENITNINLGDWVTLSKDYAKNHGESVLDKNYKILSQKVKAKDLWTNADSIHEFGYHPQP